MKHICRGYIHLPMTQPCWGSRGRVPQKPPDSGCLNVLIFLSGSDWPHHDMSHVIKCHHVKLKDIHDKSWNDSIWFREARPNHRFLACNAENICLCDLPKTKFLQTFIVVCHFLVPFADIIINFCTYWWVNGLRLLRTNVYYFLFNVW